MDTSDIQFSSPGRRRRGRYTDEFKAQIIAAWHQPGFSTAAVALANGLNANLVRRWIVQSDPSSAALLKKSIERALPPTPGGFTPRAPSRAYQAG